VRARTILVYHPDEVDAYARLVRPPRGWRVVRAGSPPDAARLVGDAEVLYAWGFPASLLASAPRLRWIQVMGAGVDRVLVPELPPRVRVTRAPIFGDWMVEYVVGWCAWITQRIELYRQAQRDHRWTAVPPDRLRGKTLALVGLGEIGRAVARAMARLGVRVIGVGRRVRRVPFVEAVYPVTRLRRALAAADFVVLALPLTPDTRGLIGGAELAAMRDGAWLINIARGAIVDEAALLEALRARRIAGAILDVFVTEPLPAEHPLWDLPDAVVTPHISGPSVPEEIAPIFDDNFRRYRAGRRLRHLVRRGRGY
jgi:phosphoglycerate dehydrogenase-like enzyme